MQHSYATNLLERQRIPLYIAGIAFACALFIGAIFSRIGWTPPTWFDVPSTGAIYAAGYSWFNRQLWKTKVLRRIGVVKTPNLNGVWKGEVITSHDGFESSHDVTISISQNWIDVSITLKSQYSESDSEIASLIVDNESVLTYEYCNEPLPRATDTMHGHRGTARLTLAADGQCLNGQYYSGRDRKNHGEMHLRRVR